MSSLFKVKFVKNGGGNPYYDGRYITGKYYDGLVRWVCDPHSPPMMMTFDDIVEFHESVYVARGDRITSYQVEPINFSKDSGCKCCCCRCGNKG